MKQPLEPRGIRVLVVEADPSRARVLGEMVRAATPAAEPAAHAGSLAQARDALRARPADIILLNPSLTDCAGLATVRVIRTLAPDAAVIVLTELDDEGIAAEALAIGVQDYLATQELSDRLLARSIRNALARTRAEAAWRASEARFRSLFEHTLDAVLLTTPDGAVLAANAAACRMFGYSEEEFRSLGRGAVVDRDDPRLAAAIDERRRTGRFIGELTFIRKDGSRIPVELSSHVFRDGGGDERTSMFIRDITARKRAEEALAASERQYRGLVLGLHDGVFICDAQNRIVEATGRMADMLGLEVEEVLRLTVPELVDPEDLANAPLRREELQRTGKLVSERRLRRADGATVPVEVASVLLGDGRVECVVRDITERRRMEREKSLLAAAGEVFASSMDHREMLRSTAGLVVPEHADWCVVDVLSEDGSPEILEVVTADARKGEVLRSLLADYPHGASPETNPVGRVLHTGEALLLREILPRQLEGMAQDARHLALARELGPVSSMVVPLVARGRILGAMTLTSSESGRIFDERDLELATELARRAALAVEKARLHERMQQAVQSRDQVLGYVAHDLRNPLGGIAIFAGLLLNEALPKARRRSSLEAILQATGQMDRLIQDLLDVGRMEGGGLRLDPEPLEAAPLVRAALPLLQASAGDAGLELHLELAGDLPRVLADRNRVLQVVSNLVGNAIKFTPRGGTVTLRARSLGAEVLFSVADTGPGIPAADLPHLFDRFWQAQRTRTGGAGLGLAIAKGIVEGHGGRIWAASEAGKGATFFFTLPCAVEAERAAGAPPVDETPPAGAPAPVAEPLRVLLVDDDPVIRRGLREMLAAGGRFDVVGEGADGEEAVRLAGELAPDVVVMDLGMPGMDGIEATRRITAALPDVRVLVLTAEPEDRWLLKVLDAGGSGLVQKATAHRDLLHAVETVAGGQVFLHPTGSQLLMRSLRDGTRAGAGDPLAELSEPERQVALLSAQGFTSREIGKRLILSSRTVDSYRSQVMKKLGLSHRAELVRLTVGAGLLRPE